MSTNAVEQSQTIVPQIITSFPITPYYLMCKNCHALVPQGAIYGFCSDCGDVMCPACARTSGVKHTISRRQEYIVISISSHLTIHFPKCRECQVLYSQKQREAGKNFLRDTSILTFVIATFILGIVVAVTFSSSSGPNPTLMAMCFGTLLIPAFFMALILAWVLKDFRLKKSIGLNLGNLTVICPLCGSNAEYDMLKTAKEVDQMKHKDFFDRWGRHNVPDLLHCSHCGYLGIATFGMGLCRHIQKYGRNKLTGTFWGEVENAVPAI